MARTTNHVILTALKAGIDYTNWIYEVFISHRSLSCPTYAFPLYPAALYLSAVWVLLASHGRSVAVGLNSRRQYGTESKERLRCRRLPYLRCQTHIDSTDGRSEDGLKAPRPYFSSRVMIKLMEPPLTNKRRH